MHMTVVSDITRKILIRAYMLTQKPIILITDPYLTHCSFQHCRFSVIRIQYRVIVAVIFKGVFIRYTQKIFIIASCKAARWKRLPFGLVIGLEGVLACPADIIFIPEIRLVDCRYYLLGFFVQGIEACKYIFF